MERNNHICRTHQFYKAWRLQSFQFFVRVVNIIISMCTSLEFTVNIKSWPSTCSKFISVLRYSKAITQDLKFAFHWNYCFDFLRRLRFEGQMLFGVLISVSQSFWKMKRKNFVIFFQNSKETIKYFQQSLFFLYY